MTPLNTAPGMPCYRHPELDDPLNDFCQGYDPSVGFTCFTYHKSDWPCTAVAESEKYDDAAFGKAAVSGCCGWREGWVPREPSFMFVLHPSFEGGRDECFTRCAEAGATGVELRTAPNVDTTFDLVQAEGDVI